MFRLTREVRFGINAQQPDPQWTEPPTNSFGGYPSLTGFGSYFTLRVTLKGALDPQSQYLINIKKIDQAAREFVREELPALREHGVNRFLWNLFAAFEELFRTRFEAVSLALTPTLVCAVTRRDILVEPMMQLSQRFEFSASHRLHNPSLSDEQNRTCFGKCSNPHGHGHNYELEVRLRGKSDDNGLIIDLPAFERIVAQTVIDRFDHKNLNREVAEFRGLNPTVENIAMVIYRLLEPKFTDEQAKLAAVTVWETPKTWCEYSE
jgi:6-pyruvoyltetrahydropterin/6-carboxytetrahydropterin synthase